MSSFTGALIAKKKLVPKRKWWQIHKIFIRPRPLWETIEPFEYRVGEEESDIYIKVPRGFETDLASIPQGFWLIETPDGNHAQAAVLHDYIYSTNGECLREDGTDEIKILSRKQGDKIFLEAMKVLQVPGWRAYTMYQAVRKFGWVGWRKRKKELEALKQKRGEEDDA